MNLEEKRAHFRQMLAQAGDFADLDNTAEAVSRAKLVVREIEAELGRADANDRAVLEREKVHAAQVLAGLDRAHADWRARVTERAARYTENQQTVYEKPLPKRGLS